MEESEGTTIRKPVTESNPMPLNPAGTEKGDFLVLCVGDPISEPGGICVGND